MKCIKTLQPLPRYHTLRDFGPGTVVRLKSRLNSNMGYDDPILIVDMQSYSLYCYHGADQHPANSKGKCVILNLATGRLSCVDSGRQCFELRAEVHTS